MISSAMLTATLSAEPSLSEVIRFAVSGLVVVVVALSILAIACSAIGWMVQHFARPVSKSIDTDQQTADPEDEIIAVIAAAVATAIDQPHRIVYVRGLVAEESAWALEGRMQHHSSHMLPHREHR